jgi:hypothetical protein
MIRCSLRFCCLFHPQLITDSQKIHVRIARREVTSRLDYGTRRESPLASTEPRMTARKCSVLARTTDAAACWQISGVTSRESGQSAAQDSGASPGAKSRGKSRKKSRDCRAAPSGVSLRLMSSDPIAFCDFLDGHQIGCGSEVADAVFLLQHRPHLLKRFSHGVIKT